jgi:branched-chain amino acid transport system substrate-binding protein
VQLDVITPNTPARTGGELLCPKPLQTDIRVEALKRAGPQLDTEKLVDTLESIRGLDMGLGTLINFGPSEHQGSHKVWGTQLDDTGRFKPIDLE